jgi:hypothetical protein
MSVLKVRNAANTDWLEVGGLAQDMSAIFDDDGDTRIMCEESSDEDIIRMDVGGQETVVLSDTQMHVYGANVMVMDLHAGDDVTGTYYRASDSTGLISGLISYGRDNATYQGHRIAIYDYLEAAWLFHSNGGGIVEFPNMPWVQCGGLTEVQNNLPIGEWVVVKFAEIQEQGGDNWNSLAWNFTAPVKGKYDVNACVDVLGWDYDASLYYFGIISSNRTYQVLHGGASHVDNANHISLQFSAVIDMDTDDTVYVAIYQSGGVAQTDIYNAAPNTFLSINLVG